jgi:hydrogenase maturation protease
MRAGNGHGSEAVAEDSRSTVVLGMGNLLLSDDGAGIRAIQQLRRDPRVPADVCLIDGGTFGLELLDYVAGASRLLILDSIDAELVPGSLLRMEGEDLHTLRGGGSVHELGLADLLAALRLMGKEPAAVVLIGIQPARTCLDLALSPAVEAALDDLVEAAIAELRCWQAR